MRISLLEKREDFYEILTVTLTSWLVEKNMKTCAKKTFTVNRYLNFVAHSQLPTSVFKILKKEYSASQSKWKRLLQRIYVSLAIYQPTRPFFSNKIIKLPEHYTSYLILGGNHRIRLFKQNLKSSYIILKNRENFRFIDNEISLKNELQPAYAPSIKNWGTNWLEEEYFEGKPLNRLSGGNKKNVVAKQLTQIHVENLLKLSMTQIPVNDYLQEAEKTVHTVLNHSAIIMPDSIRTTIQSTFSGIINKLNGQYSIPIAWSHGDFQAGNVLVAGNTFKVIDWEASDKRMWLYDLFIFLGEIRTHGNLQKAFQLFETKKMDWELLKPFPENWKLWLAFEELIFCIYEDCSVNFYQSGLKTNQLCNQINTLFLS